MKGLVMKTLNYTEVRSNLSNVLDRVNADSEPVLVFRGKNKERSVILSEDDYNGLVETAYLLSSPKNAEKLLQSIKDVRNGERGLVLDLGE